MWEQWELCRNCTYYTTLWPWRFIVGTHMVLGELLSENKRILREKPSSSVFLARCEWCTRARNCCMCLRNPEEQHWWAPLPLNEEGALSAHHPCSKSNWWLVSARLLWRHMIMFEISQYWQDCKNSEFKFKLWSYFSKEREFCHTNDLRRYSSTK